MAHGCQIDEAQAVMLLVQMSSALERRVDTAHQLGVNVTELADALPGRAWPLAEQAMSGAAAERMLLQQLTEHFDHQSKAGTLEVSVMDIRGGMPSTTFLTGMAILAFIALLLMTVFCFQLFSEASARYLRQEEERKLDQQRMQRIQQQQQQQQQQRQQQQQQQPNLLTTTSMKQLPTTNLISKPWFPSTASAPILRAPIRPADTAGLWPAPPGTPTRPTEAAIHWPTPPGSPSRRASVQLPASAAPAFPAAVASPVRSLPASPVRSLPAMPFLPAAAAPPVQSLPTSPVRSPPAPAVRSFFPPAAAPMPIQPVPRANPFASRKASFTQPVLPLDRSSATTVLESYALSPRASVVLASSPPEPSAPVGQLQRLVVPQLLHGGKLGLSLAEADLTVLGFNDPQAMRFGFSVGDRIMAVNRNAVTTQADFVRELARAAEASAEGGRPVVFDIARAPPGFQSLTRLDTSTQATFRAGRARSSSPSMSFA